MRRACLVTLLFLLCAVSHAQDIRAPYQALADSVTRLMGYAPVPGNSFRMYRTGKDFLAALLEDLEAARETIDLEYYWFTADEVGRPVRDALARKAREGLRVRVLVDNRIIPFVPKAFFRKLEKAGASLCFCQNLKKTRLWELPGMIIGERDHRKIVVLDGRVCYTGGMNLCDHILEWNDTHMRIEGTIASSMSELFDQSWQAVSGEQPAQLPPPVASADGHAIAQLVYGDGSPILEEAYVQLLDHVQYYIYLRSPYLVPPPRLMKALNDAGRRGVDVRILIPLESDWRFMNDITAYYFDSLHEAGVRVYTYAPSYDHSKCFVADDYLSSCGTVNLDNRSFFINAENGVFCYDEEEAGKALMDFLDMLQKSEEVREGQGRASGFKKAWTRFLVSIADLL